MTAWWSRPRTPTVGWELSPRELRWHVLRGRQPRGTGFAICTNSSPVLALHAGGSDERDRHTVVALLLLAGGPPARLRCHAPRRPAGHPLRPCHGCGIGYRRRRRDRRGCGRIAWRHRRSGWILGPGSGGRPLRDHHPDRVRDHPCRWDRRGSGRDCRRGDPDPLPRAHPQPDRGHGLAPPGEGARRPGVCLLGLLDRDRANDRDDARRPCPGAARARHLPDEPLREERRRARLQQRLLRHAPDDHRQPLRAHPLPALQLLRPHLHDRPGHRPHRGLARAGLRPLRAQRRQRGHAHHHRIAHRPSRHLRLRRRWRALDLLQPVQIRPRLLGRVRDQGVGAVHAGERFRVRGPGRGRGRHAAGSEARRSPTATSSTSATPSMPVPTSARTAGAPSS